MKNSFLRGWMSCAAFTSLYQDLVYKDAENYAKHVLNSWVDRRITVPIAIIFIGMIIIWGILDRIEQELSCTNKK